MLQRIFCGQIPIQFHLLEYGNRIVPVLLSRSVLAVCVIRASCNSRHLVSVDFRYPRASSRFHLRNLIVVILDRSLFCLFQFQQFCLIFFFVFFRSGFPILQRIDQRQKRGGDTCKLSFHTRPKVLVRLHRTVYVFVFRLNLYLIRQSQRSIPVGTI
ncbi:PF12686 family protein [Leptospira santarosai]|nr:PF12686 family protein [Leptospira santarosai]